MDAPCILKENENYAVVFKPPGMHCREKTASSKEQITDNREQAAEQAGTLLEWYKRVSPPVYDIMHRLDFETHGLVLFAKNETSYNFFKAAQDNGSFIKEYSAICMHSENENRSLYNNGFPPCSMLLGEMEDPFVIESYFRPYGPGRKLVRPVIEDGKKHKETAKDKGGFYKTEIINFNKNSFTVRIKRGFRHQIRCHLCWIGYPILNDPLYLQTESLNYLSLRSHALFFPDPVSGKQLEYGIEPLKSPGFP